VTAATFWFGAHAKNSGTFAGKSVSLVVAVGVPESMRTLQAAVATSRTAQVSDENAVDAALTAETLTFWDAPCREQGCLGWKVIISFLLDVKKPSAKAGLVGGWWW
jgi:hypothetical protein